MSKRALVSAAIAGIALVDAVPAVAQVTYVAVAPYDSTGFYLGGEIGGWNTRVDYSGGFEGSVSRSSVLGGFYAGYNYQYGNLVLGTEGRFDLTDFCGRFASLRTETHWTGSAVLRVGYSINNFMPYLAGGVAVADQSLRFPRMPDYNTRTGWTASGGIEVQLRALTSYSMLRNSTARLEYRHIDFGTVDVFDGEFRSRVVSDAVLFGFSTKIGKYRA